MEFESAKKAAERLGVNIRTVQKWAKENNFSGIKLLTHPYRVQAHRFYEGRGNSYTKDQKNYMKMFK